MSNKNHLEDYQLFFMEIPSQTTQDLEDIQIIDANEEAPEQPCLTDDQVSQISRDVLNPAPQITQEIKPPPASSQRQLFDN